MEAAARQAGGGGAPLSRLRADKFTEDVAYAAGYVQEHWNNFAAMVRHLMKSDTLARVASDTSDLCLRLNDKLKWVPPVYNNRSIKPAYQLLESYLSQGEREIVLDGAEAYFEVLKRNAKTPGANMFNVFAEIRDKELKEQGPLRTFVVSLLGDDFDREKCERYFLPQLLPFWMRFFDVYDNSLQGQTVQGWEDSTDAALRSAEGLKVRIPVGETPIKLFGDRSYWEERYTKGAEGPEYDWYRGFDALGPLVIPYLTLAGESAQSPSSSSASSQTKPRILNVGCGNSTFAESLYDLGYKEIVNIDYAPNVIDFMKQRTKETGREGLEYITMDASDMSHFPEKSFDVVMEKGTIDAIMCGFEGEITSGKMCHEIARVLKDGGVFLEMSFRGPSAPRPFMQGSNYGWEMIDFFAIEPKTPPKSDPGSDGPNPEKGACYLYVMKLGAAPVENVFERRKKEILHKYQHMNKAASHSSMGNDQEKSGDEKASGKVSKKGSDTQQKSVNVPPIKKKEQEKERLDDFLPANLKKGGGQKKKAGGGKGKGKAKPKVKGGKK